MVATYARNPYTDQILLSLHTDRQTDRTIHFSTQTDKYMQTYIGKIPTDTLISCRKEMDLVDRLFEMLTKESKF